MAPEVPKKFYRQVLKGVSYFTIKKKRDCNLRDVVSYVYLKNARNATADICEDASKRVLNKLCSEGVIQKNGTKFRLNFLVPSGGPRQQPTAVDRGEIEPAPSSSAGGRASRRQPSFTKRTARKVQRKPSRPRRRSGNRRPTDMEVASQGSIEQEGSDEDFWDDDDEEDFNDGNASTSTTSVKPPTEPFQHKPIKKDIDAEVVSTQVIAIPVVPSTKTLKVSSEGTTSSSEPTPRASSVQSYQMLHSIAD
ncbi:uncharacterized protein LOC129755404 isoform X2 [Uranotaenia lowii]|uniref:uncharacterized protein LOC129755404 isoform X2 n=1 Tax=Uranotaenia lowii TaxID=190385 RepID=UPI0024797141|nr:uncharacterized protein LOC129755404 isoform X2 [Uranotaenia lowii]